MKTRRAVIDPKDGHSIIRLKRYSSRQRNWITFWKGEMLLARARIIKREWEQDGNAEGVL